MHIILFFSNFFYVFSYKFYSIHNYENNYIYYEDVWPQDQRVIIIHRDLKKIEQCINKCQDVHHECNTVVWSKLKPSGIHYCQLAEMTVDSRLEPKSESEDAKYSTYTRRVS